ncbi:MAG: hypothetical protein HJJLKODD_01634 [Phycisphaerae bacterium]|nr:hypothetical protein [Phycisphaerae bacterium]
MQNVALRFQAINGTTTIIISVSTSIIKFKYLIELTLCQYYITQPFTAVMVRNFIIKFYWGVSES